MAPCPSGGDGRRSPRRSAPTKNTIELSSAAPPYAGDSIAIPVLHAPRRATRARAQSAVESSSARSRASGGFATAAWTHQHLKRYVLRTVLLGTLIALTPLVTSARAATITVNTTADSSTYTSDCTLRDAITAANTD